jgi:hypothetical protein
MFPFSRNPHGIISAVLYFETRSQISRPKGYLKQIETSFFVRKSTPLIEASQARKSCASRHS